MSIASQLLHRSQQISGHRVTETRTGERIWSCVQFLWLGVTFLLFLIMGPFAAIAVVPAVFSLAGNLRDAQEPEAEVASGRQF